MPARSSASSETGPPLSTVVAGEDARLRRAVRDVLEQAGITVLAEARDGREAVALAVRHRPDVLLIDVRMPRLDGVPATRRIIELHPPQVIVLLASKADEELAWLGVQSGAVGFVRNDADLASLPRVVRGAAAGEAVLSRAGLGRVLALLRSQA
jgi:NarL family two-component system response regulator LiaR